MSRKEPDPVGDILRKSDTKPISPFGQLIAFTMFCIILVGLVGLLLMVIKWAMNIW